MNLQGSFYFVPFRKMEEKKKLRQEAKRVLQKVQTDETEIYRAKAKRKKFRRWFIFLQRIRHHMQRAQKIQRRGRARLELPLGVV